MQHIRWIPSCLVSQGAAALEHFCVFTDLFLVSHIIDSRLPINISDICTLIEHLCSACVISIAHYRNGGFHGVTLPRSWLLRHLNRHQGAQVDFTLLQSFVMQRISVLLETIFSGSEAGQYISQQYFTPWK